MKAAGVGKVGPNGAVLGRCHGGQHVPGVDELFHDFADSGEFFKRVAELVFGHISNRGAQLVQHQLHPQLAGLVLNDEQHFIVVWRAWLLRAQQFVEMQVVAIGH